MDMSWSKLQEMVKVREAWRAAVHGFTNSWTWLSDWTTSRVSEIQLNSKTISLEVESDSTDKRLSPIRLVSTSDISCKPGLLPVLLTNQLQIRFQQSFLLFRMPTESPDCYLYSWLDINQRSPQPPLWVLLTCYDSSQNSGKPIYPLITSLWQRMSKKIN